MASAPTSDSMTRWNVSMSGTSTINPTRCVFAGSTKVRAVIPSGPKVSARRGDASQCSTSSTSWKISTVAIAASPFACPVWSWVREILGRPYTLGQAQTTTNSEHIRTAPSAFVPFVQWVGVLARHHSQSVDEVSIEYESHVVEEERFEGRKDGFALHACRAGRSLHEPLVSSQLLGNGGLGVVNLIRGATPAPEHDIPSFRRWGSQILPA